jgi:hypothetical protein
LTIPLRRNRPQCVEEMANVVKDKVAANRELIARFEKKIQAALALVWGEDKPEENGLQVLRL